MIVGGDSQSFVGREGELALLESELVRARARTPRLVLVEGPGGIGKSLLLRRFLAGNSDVRLLIAGGDEAEARLPYGVITQLVRSGETDLQIDAHDDPLLVGARLLEKMSELENDRALVVVVDDAQWADSASLQALTFGLRRLHVDPVLAVIAARDAASNLPDGLVRLARERGHILALAGLSVEDLGKIASSCGRSLPRRSLERLHAHTEGNPLWAVALLTELSPEALARDAGPLPAPRSFATLVAAKLGSCGEETRGFVQAAAVIGPRSRVGLAATVAGLADAAGALDEAVAAGFLDFGETPTARELRFRHPLVRASIYHDMGPAHRGRLHARAAEHLSGVSGLDHRIAAALVEDAVLASEVEAHARAEAADGAVGAAASHLMAAARLSPDLGTRGQLVLDAVELLLLSGEVAQAASLAEELADVADSARGRYVLGYLALLTGRQAEAEELLVGAWELSDKSEGQLRALIATQLLRLCAIQVRAHEAVEWGQRSLALGNHPLSAFSLHGLVVYLALIGRVEEALRLVESLPEGSAVGLSDRELGGLLGRGQVRMFIGDLRGAHSDLTAVVDATRPRLASDVRLFALGYLAETEYRLGAWEESVIHAALAVSLANDAGQAWILAFVHAQASWALAAKGDWASAEEHVKAALAAAQAMGDLASVSYASAAEVHLAFSRGHWSDAMTAAQRLLAAPPEPVFEPGVLPWREQYTDALVALGRLEQAEAVLTPFEEQSASRARVIPMAAAARARGRLEAARGNSGRARDAFEAGLDLLRGQPAPFERALLQDAYGRSLRREGMRREAAAHLEAARQAYEELRARPFAERVGRELAASGLSPRSRASGPSTALTPQELAVARLVADGQSNKEVAAELVVSAKTVEYHLGNIYAKLGVHSRRALRGYVPERAGAAKTSSPSG